MNTAQQQQQDQDIWNEEAKAIDADEPAPAQAAVDTDPPGDEPAGDEPQGQQATDQPQQDEWQGVPEPIRKKIEQITVAHTRVVDDLSHQLKSANGRIGAMQRQLEAAAQQRAANPNDDAAPSGAQVSDASADPEKWKKLREDFPEWAEGIDEMVSSRLSKANAPAVDPETVRTTAVEAMREALVEDEHPGWKDTVNTPEFRTWFESQPEDTKALAKSSRSKDAITLLDRFVAGKQSSASNADDIAAARQRRQERNVTVRGQQGANQMDESAMTDDQYWEYMARQQQGTA